MFGLWIFRVLLDKPWGYSIDIFFLGGGVGGWGVGGLCPLSISRQLENLTR